MTQLTQLKRPLNLRETVLNQIRTAIVTGELPEGELVSAPTLGQLFGVSATPVREAMMDLAREGLVETVKNKGFRITTMTEKDLDDLAEIRLLLEPPIMHQVVGNIPDEAFDELLELADRSLKGAETEDLTEYLRHDRAFHALLLSFSGNAQLVELATSLRVRTRMYGLVALASAGKLAASAKEHHTLIDLLRAGKADEAEALLRRHIGHARGEWATGDGAQSQRTADEQQVPEATSA